MKIVDIVPSDDSHQQGEGDVPQRVRTQHERSDEQDGGDRQSGDDTGVDRPHQRLVDGQVHGLPKVCRDSGPSLARVLPHLVEHHDGVVEGEAEDGQEPDDRARRDLETGGSVDTGRDDEDVDQ